MRAAPLLSSPPAAPVVATAVSALDLLRPGSLTSAEPGLAAAPDLSAAPLLVVAWGCQLQLLQLFHEQPAGPEEDAAGAGMRIEQLGRFEGDAEIISLAWLRSGPLLALDSRHFLHAFDAELQERDILPLQSLQLNAPSPDESRRLRAAAHGAVCADSHGLLLLGEGGIYCVRVLSWLDQLNTVVQVAAPGRARPPAARRPDRAARRAAKGRGVGVVRTATESRLKMSM